MLGLKSGPQILNSPWPKYFPSNIKNKVIDWIWGIRCDMIWWYNQQLWGIIQMLVWPSILLICNAKMTNLRTNPYITYILSYIIRWMVMILLLLYIYVCILLPQLYHYFIYFSREIFYAHLCIQTCINDMLFQSFLLICNSTLHEKYVIHAQICGGVRFISAVFQGCVLAAYQSWYPRKWSWHNQKTKELGMPKS